MQHCFQSFVQRDEAFAGLTKRASFVETPILILIFPPAVVINYLWKNSPFYIDVPEHDDTQAAAEQQPKVVPLAKPPGENYFQTNKKKTLR